MSSIDLKSLAKSVSLVARQTGQFIASQKDQLQDHEVSEKGLNQLVSYVDQQAEAMIIAELKKLLPSSTFLAEESAQDENLSELTWIIDPLDGTTNFIHGVPAYAVSIALARQSELVLGVVYEICRDETFLAYKGGGAFCNEKIIQVKQNADLSKSLLATGFPYYDFSHREHYLKVLSHFMESTRGIRRLGSAAVDLCYVANGMFDGFFEYDLSPWDVAAGALIVKEAGGKVSDFKDGDDFLMGGEILAASAGLHSHLLEIIASKG